MSTSKLWAQPVKPAPAMTKDELRQRILAVVSDRKQTTEAEIWRANTPNFLPWDSMIEEITLLDREQKLRRQVVAPGHIVIHAVKTPPAVKSNPGKPTRRSGKPTKKTDPEPILPDSRPTSAQPHAYTNNPRLPLHESQRRTVWLNRYRTGRNC